MFHFLPRQLHTRRKNTIPNLLQDAHEWALNVPQPPVAVMTRPTNKCLPALPCCGISTKVWRYLSEYAGVASMPTADMFDLKELLQAARDAHTEWRRQQQRRRCVSPPHGGSFEFQRPCILPCCRTLCAPIALMSPSPIHSLHRA